MEQNNKNNPKSHHQPLPRRKLHPFLVPCLRGVTLSLKPAQYLLDPRNQTSGTLSPPGKQDIQVSTITKTLPDGRTVQTRIVRGPVQRKARIIKINRELPNGETELLSTLQVPGDQEIDIDETVKSIVAGGKKHVDFQGKSSETIKGAGIKRKHKPPPLEQYDNIPLENHVQPTPPPQPTHSESSTCRP